MNNKVGIIAGNGKLPLAIAAQAKKAGYQIFICAIKGEAETAIENFAEETEWIVLGQLAKVIKFFKRVGVSEVIMAGKVTKTNLFKGEVRPDLDMIRVITKTKDRKDDTLLGAISNYLEEKGLRVLSSVAFLGDALPSAGVLSKQKPSREDQEEIKFGWEVAKQIAGLDIGQTVITKNKAVIAVEAIEGTDQAIVRAGELVHKGVQVFKVAKPNQDMRFDVPTIGLKTLDSMIQAGARMLVFEAGKTILLDREEFIKKANEQKMIVIARDHAKRDS